MAQPHGALTRVASARKYADGGFVDGFVQPSAVISVPDPYARLDALPAHPTQQQIQEAWNANRADPAKIYQLMQQNGVGVNEVAKMLNVDNNTMAQYLNLGRSTGTKQVGFGDDMAFQDQNKYAEVHPEAQTKDEFQSTIQPWMLDSNGKFKGPGAGVNYRWEGMTPDEVFAQKQPKAYDPNQERDGSIQGLGPGQDRMAYYGETHGGTYGGGGSTAAEAPWDPINLKWEPGPDNGGGGIAAVGRAIGNTGTAMVNNPAIMAAMTAGVGQYLAPTTVAGDVASAGEMGGNTTNAALYGNAGYGTEPTMLQSAMASPYAKPIISAGKTIASGGSLKDAAISGLANYAGSEAGSAVSGLTDSSVAGSTANALMQSAIKGDLSGNTINGLATQYAMGKITDLSGLPPQVVSIVVNLAKNKKTSPVGALTSIANAAQKPQPTGGP